MCIRDSVHIGPFCIVGANVEIGEGTVLKSHVVVNGHTKIGRDNEIYRFASIFQILVNKGGQR